MPQPARHKAKPPSPGPLILPAPYFVPIIRTLNSIILLFLSIISHPLSHTQPITAPGLSRWTSCLPSRHQKKKKSSALLLPSQLRIRPFFAAQLLASRIYSATSTSTSSLLSPSRCAFLLLFFLPSHTQNKNQTIFTIFSSGCQTTFDSSHFCPYVSAIADSQIPAIPAATDGLRSLSLGLFFWLPIATDLAWPRLFSSPDRRRITIFVFLLDSHCLA
ncbi:hypothetical protein V8C37DRAFT_110517 [Trichoderma ceciliae]